VVSYGCEGYLLLLEKHHLLLNQTDLGLNYLKILGATSDSLDIVLAEVVLRVLILLGFKLLP
jgi:hypothetical protein